VCNLSYEVKFKILKLSKTCAWVYNLRLFIIYKNNKYCNKKYFIYIYIYIYKSKILLGIKEPKENIICN